MRAIIIFLLKGTKKNLYFESAESDRRPLSKVLVRQKSKMDEHIFSIKWPNCAYASKKPQSEQYG